MPSTAARQRWKEKNPGYAKQWYAKNRERLTDYNRAWREKNRAKIQRQDRERKREKLGITPEIYASMWAEQGGVCAICGKPEMGRTRGGTIKSLHVDHNHTTGKVRALLCSRCNRTLGQLEESIPLLRGMIGYITKHQGS